MKFDNIQVRLPGNRVVINDIKSLEKIGAGHDGIVYKYKDLALKYLKYDIELRKERNLMTFDKVNYLIENLNMNRITAPTDILLNEDGIYVGYAMPFIDDLSSDKRIGTKEYKAPGSFLYWDLMHTIGDLTSDFEQLTASKVEAVDINRGSYMYASDFMYLCDTDKYMVKNKISSSVDDANLRNLNFTIAKFLFYEMQKSKIYTPSDLKVLKNWVKKSSNSRTFIRELSNEMGTDYNQPISEYTEYKIKKLVR